MRMKSLMPVLSAAAVVLGLFVGPALMAALVLLWREWVEAGDIGAPEDDA